VAAAAWHSVTVAVSGTTVTLYVGSAVACAITLPNGRVTQVETSVDTSVETCLETHDQC
jgi:hypothetical protein